MDGVKCVLLDIEGTILEIAFVKDVLFPYALKALPGVLESKWDDEDFKPYKEAFPAEAQESPEALQAHVEDLTQRDVKIASLKNLQGYLWETGYKTGAYSTSLFSDVAPRLKEWKKAGVHLAIYSSGSVFAQRLLFGHVKADSRTTGQKRARTDDNGEDKPDESKAPPAQRRAASGDDDEGAKDLNTTQVPDEDDNKVDNDEAKSRQEAVEDLQYLISDWFDTTNAGAKTESGSYVKIARSLKVDPNDILFLSDNVKEVDAAIECGMRSVVLDRPGNAAISSDDRGCLTVVTSLDEIDLRAVGTDNNDVTVAQKEVGAD